MTSDRPGSGTEPESLDRLRAELDDALRRERDAVARAEEAGRRLQLLIRISAAAGSSFDYREALDSLARVLVGQIADICAIDLLVNGVLERVSVVRAILSACVCARTGANWKPKAETAVPPTTVVLMKVLRSIPWNSPRRRWPGWTGLTSGRSCSAISGWSAGWPCPSRRGAG